MQRVAIPFYTTDANTYPPPAEHTQASSSPLIHHAPPHLHVQGLHTKPMQPYKTLNNFERPHTNTLSIHETNPQAALSTHIKTRGT